MSRRQLLMPGAQTNSIPSSSLSPRPSSRCALGKFLFCLRMCSMTGNMSYNTSILGYSFPFPGLCIYIRLTLLNGWKTFFGENGNWEAKCRTSSETRWLCNV